MKEITIFWEDLKTNIESKLNRNFSDQVHNEDIWDSLDQLIVLTVFESMYPGFSARLTEIYNIKNLDDLKQYFDKLEFKIV